MRTPAVRVAATAVSNTRKEPLFTHTFCFTSKEEMAQACSLCVCLYKATSERRLAPPTLPGTARALQSRRNGQSGARGCQGRRCMCVSIGDRGAEVPWIRCCGLEFRLCLFTRRGCGTEARVCLPSETTRHHLGIRSSRAWKIETPLLPLPKCSRKEQLCTSIGA